MQIVVSGKNMDVGASLREHVETALEGGVSKYFDRAIDADVLFSKEAHLFCTDIIVNEGTGSGVIIKSQAKSDDVYASFDMAAARIEKQLRRYKRRLKNHRGKHSEQSHIVSGAVKYVLSEKGEEGEEVNEHDNPLIIAEKKTKIETLTVSDAVMLMNLANLPALMFINKKNGCISVVYHRNDGNISWVDSDIACSLKCESAA